MLPHKSFTVNAIPVMAANTSDGECYMIITSVVQCSMLVAHSEPLIVHGQYLKSLKFNCC